MSVVLYSEPGCLPCTLARRLLRRSGVEFEEVPGVPRPRLRELTGGVTYPQVVVRDEPVGGYDELAALQRNGALAALLRGDEFPVTVVRRRFSPVRVVPWLLSALGGGGCGPFRHSVELVDRDGSVLERRPVSALEAALVDEHAAG